LANRTTTWINAYAVRLQDPLPTVHYALRKKPLSSPDFFWTNA
jgi:hypothetical protein